MLMALKLTVGEYKMFSPDEKVMIYRKEAAGYAVLATAHASAHAIDHL